MRVRRVVIFYVSAQYPAQMAFIKYHFGYCGSFNSKLCDEFLARKTFYTMKKAKILIEWRRRRCNTRRPRASLGYKSPAPKAILPTAVAPPYVQGVAA